jgi:hypothetical protein
MRTWLRSSSPGTSLQHAANRDGRNGLAFGRASHQSHNEEQDHSAEQRGEEGKPMSSTRDVEAEVLEYKSAEESTDYPDDDVHQNARAGALDDFAVGVAKARY